MSESFELPLHCMFCGAWLAGSLTRHRADCEMRRMMDELMPGHSLLPPEEEPEEEGASDAD